MYNVAIPKIQNPILPENKNGRNPKLPKSYELHKQY
jgi:hypothetical protein